MGSEECRRREARDDVGLRQGRETNKHVPPKIGSELLFDRDVKMFTVPVPSAGRLPQRDSHGYVTVEA